MNDLFLHYKHVVRFLLVQKLARGSDLSESTIYGIPAVVKCLVFFNIKDLVDFEDLRGSNYFFLFRYFFGRRAFCVNYKTRFSLNVLYHSCRVQFVLRKRDVYFVMNFLLYDIIPFVSVKNFFIRVKGFFLIFELLDMNLFLEKKTHVGFFNLKDNLYVKFCSIGLDGEGGCLFSCFKLLAYGNILI